jgi:uncharacterized protein YerC
VELKIRECEAGHVTRTAELPLDELHRLRALAYRATMTDVWERMVAKAPAIEAETRARVVQLRSEGMPWRRIVQTTGLSSRTARRIISEHEARA